MGRAAFPYIVAVAAFAVAAVLAWAVLIYGPAQKKAGGLEKAVQLDQATKDAANDLINKAEAARLRSRLCADTGGLYDFAAGKCKR